ncbi:MAG TPA: RodZ domain-containing protein [Thermoanaerobaculia bacterium]|jgi:cytoskeletal protein RodZ|nr:RodZ domain-containing protein [Thermoanaerobaculia bacterium]
MGETPALTFGEELRRERLIRDVSLEEISAATKISIRLLTALESSDLSRLPAPVFTRGFIRAYSRHLGLDGDEMVNAYLADVAPDRPKDSGPAKGRTRSRFMRGRRGAAGSIVVVVAGVLIISGLMLRPERRAAPARAAAPRPSAPVTFKNVAVSPLPAPQAAATVPFEASSVAPVADPGAPEADATPTSGVRLLLEFDQDSWTEVTADGQRIFSGLIKAGSRRQFDAREGFKLTFGNAGAVRVTLDGRALDRLGSAGQVVRNIAIPGPRQTRVS